MSAITCSRRAVAQRAQGAADPVEAEAVAACRNCAPCRPAGSGRRPASACGSWRIRAAGRSPLAPRRLGDAAGGAEVQRVREFEVAHLQRPLVERDPLVMRLAAVPAGQHQRLEFGMLPLEIGGVAEPGLRQRGRRDRYGSRRRIAAASAPCAAGPHARYGIRRSGPASGRTRCAIDCWKPPQAAELRRRPAASGSAAAWSWTLVWQALQALSLHRLERPDVAGLAIGGRARHGALRQVAAAPQLIGMDSPSPCGRPRRDSGRRRRSARRGRWPSTSERPAPRPWRACPASRSAARSGGCRTGRPPRRCRRAGCRSATSSLPISAAGCAAGRGRP